MRSIWEILCAIAKKAGVEIPRRRERLSEADRARLLEEIRRAYQHKFRDAEKQ
jgi:hypothetical protein